MAGVPEHQIDYVPNANPIDEIWQHAPNRHRIRKPANTAISLPMGTAQYGRDRTQVLVGDEPWES